MSEHLQNLNWKGQYWDLHYLLTQKVLPRLGKPVQSTITFDSAKQHTVKLQSGYPSSCRAIWQKFGTRKCGPLTLQIRINWIAVSWQTLRRMPARSPNQQSQSPCSHMMGMGQNDQEYLKVTCHNVFAPTHKQSLLLRSIIQLNMFTRPKTSCLYEISS